jgi:hypothetical protein
MQAHKLTITVPPSGHVEFDLPPELAGGGEAEVIVLLQPKPSAPQLRPGSREAILAGEAAIDAWRAAHPEMIRTAEEIDADIAQERASWGEDP